MRVKELVSILEEELSLFDTLIELMTVEGEVVGSLDVERIDDHLRKKTELIERIRALDARREEILSREGCSGKSLREIARQWGDDELSRIAREFREKIERVTELNRINSLLIEKSLLYVSSSFRFLRDLGVNPKARVSVEA
ncbi:MAG: flagellar protein FlgN [Deltaproteobacteria bacterium]|nr:MAG: flagellar protein FlgN [Deltaproteobacteria bacterium]